MREDLLFASVLLFAEVPTPTGPELTAWLIGLFALVFVAERAVSLFNGVKAMTRKARNRKVAPGLRFVTKDELKELKEELSGSIKKVEDYAHHQFHELRDILHTMDIKLAVLVSRGDPDPLNGAAPNP